MDYSKNMHESIVDKELFEKAQGMRKVDTRVQNSGNLSMWAGILKCADCGRAMHKNTVKIKVVLFMNITYVEHIEKSPINYAQSIL